VAIAVQFSLPVRLNFRSSEFAERDAGPLFTPRAKQPPSDYAGADCVIRLIPC
jgi:hypothetical protein